MKRRTFLTTIAATPVAAAAPAVAAPLASDIRIVEVRHAYQDYV